MPAVKRSAFLARFECLGERCPDTCCKAWNMQLDPPMREKYRVEAPELLDAVADDGSGGFIMRRDPQTDYCVKYESGLCGIHKERGSSFLGDACHFYPRVTRKLGESVIMTATPSCPEIVRLAVEQDGELRHEDAESERLPYSLKDYLPEGMDSEAALAVHRAFLAAADADAPAETILLRIGSVARSLERLPMASWAQAAEFYLKSADGRLPPPETVAEDPFNLLHALCGLIVAARKKPAPPLADAIRAVEQALNVTLDWENVTIATGDDSAARYAALKAGWDEKYAAAAAPLLRRWLQLQLAMALFPFSGFGRGLDERVTILGVRLATLRLLLMAVFAQGTEFKADTFISVAYSLSRALDHLADPSFSIQIYTETGWMREARLRGLLN